MNKSVQWLLVIEYRIDIYTLYMVYASHFNISFPPSNLLLRFQFPTFPSQTSNQPLGKKKATCVTILLPTSRESNQIDFPLTAIVLHNRRQSLPEIVQDPPQIPIEGFQRLGSDTLQLNKPKKKKQTRKERKKYAADLLQQREFV